MRWRRGRPPARPCSCPGPEPSSDGYPCASSTLETATPDKRTPGSRPASSPHLRPRTLSPIRPKMASPLTRMKRHRRFIGSRLALQCLSVRAARHRCVPTLSRRNPVRYSGLRARTRCGSGIVRQEQPHEELRGWKVRPTMVFPLPMSLSRRRNGVRAGSSACLLSGRPIAGFCRPFSKVHGRSRAAGIACPNPTSRSVRLRGATQPGRSASKSGTIAFPTNLAASVTNVSAPFFRAGRTMRWSCATCRTTTGSRVTRIRSPSRPSPLQIRIRSEPPVKGRSPASGFVPSTISRVRDRR